MKPAKIPRAVNGPLVVSAIQNRMIDATEARAVSL
jgi:hypothetical protein